MSAAAGHPAFGLTAQALEAKQGPLPLSREWVQPGDSGLGGQVRGADPFDTHAHHLLLHTPALPGEGPRVVARCRVLTPVGARAVGGFVMDADFDLVRLRSVRHRMAEISGLRIEEGWRRMSTLESLWQVLVPFLNEHGLDRVIGTAGLPLRDGGRQMAERLGRWRQQHLATPDLHARPRWPLPLGQTVPNSRWPLREGLLHACLQRGAVLLGPPGCSAERGTAELPLMLRVTAAQELARTSSIVVTPASTFSMPS